MGVMKDRVNLKIVETQSHKELSIMS